MADDSNFVGRTLRASAWAIAGITACDDLLHKCLASLAMMAGQAASWSGLTGRRKMISGMLRLHPVETQLARLQLQFLPV